MADVDVVIIGSGGAGLIAAIASLKEGASVVVLSKTLVGTASCTAYSNAFFTTPCENLSLEEYCNKVIRVGRGINRRDLVMALGEDAFSSLKELQSWGVTLKFLKGGHATAKDSSNIPIASGAGFISELKTIAIRGGVRFVENVCATDILTSNSQVYGVEYCNWITGAHGLISCNSVVIATGGSGQIFKRTDNPSRITGDGYALALKASLPLADMEFVQFYPLGFAEPHFPCWMINLSILDIARITDEKGREFIKEKMKEWELASGQELSLYARDRTARVIQEKLAQGGEVLLHLEDIGKEKWDEWDLEKVRSCFPQRLSPEEYGPVHVSPVEHYFCGGIAIDENAATSIRGLYACGEVTGGIDGASRLGGNALTNMVSFAIKAGREAANEALTRLSKSSLTLEGEIPLKVSYGDDGIDPARIRNKIKALCQEYLGPLRDEKGLKKAILELEEIYKNIPKMKTEKPQDLLLALEMEGLLLTSLAVAHLAYSRKESRGVHYRTDFPLEVPEMQRSQFVKLREGEFMTGLVDEKE